MLSTARLLRILLVVIGTTETVPSVIIQVMTERRRGCLAIGSEVWLLV